MPVAERQALLQKNLRVELELLSLEKDLASVMVRIHRAKDAELPTDLWFIGQQTVDGKPCPKVAPVTQQLGTAEMAAQNFTWASLTPGEHRLGLPLIMCACEEPHWRPATAQEDPLGVNHLKESGKVFDTGIRVNELLVTVPTP